MKTTTHIVSKFAKGDKVAVLHSRKRNTEVKRTTEFWFTGWNPLPICGAFESTYYVLYQWLKENGWEPVARETNVVCHVVVQEVTK